MASLPCSTAAGRGGNFMQKLISLTKEISSTFQKLQTRMSFAIHAYKTWH